MNCIDCSFVLVLGDRVNRGAWSTVSISFIILYIAIITLLIYLLTELNSPNLPIQKSLQDFYHFCHPPLEPAISFEIDDQLKPCYPSNWIFLLVFLYLSVCKCQVYSAVSSDWAAEEPFSKVSIHTELLSTFQKFPRILSRSVLVKLSKLWNRV